MKDISETPLVKLLTILSKEERKELKKFIASPYWIDSAVCQRLLDYIEKSFPKLSKVRLKKERVFKHTFPDDAFNEKKLDKTLSGLRTLTLQFLSFQELKKDEVLQQKLLIRAFDRLNEYDEMKKEWDKLLKDLETASPRDASYHKEHFEAQYHFYFHPSASKYTHQPQFIEKTAYHFDRFLVLKYLRCAAEMELRKVIFREDYTMVFLETVLQETKSLFKKEEPVALIYFNMIKLFRKGIDKALFEDTVKLFVQHLNRLEVRERPGVLSLLISYAAHLYYKGETAYLLKFIDLYKFGLKKGLLLHNGLMLASTFLNISIALTIAKLFDFVLDFIEKYQYKLAAKDSLWVVDLSRAFVLFHQKKFGQVRQLLVPISPPNWRAYILMKTLKIRCDFELFSTEDNELDNEIHAFQKWIYENQKGHNRESYLAFCRIVTKLKSGNINFKKQDLLQEINHETNLALKDWLIEKVQELDI